MNGDSRFRFSSEIHNIEFRSCFLLGEYDRVAKIQYNEGDLLPTENGESGVAG